ncbi:MAG: GDP-mannose 4,6-dehydratase [Thermoleophilaceae bacterium]|nr:GDP-mannose 4,6-dehydratase [Thermoleophilaceae bacterium]
MGRGTFVTGGGGFAGRHLLERLEREGRAAAAPRHAELDLRDAAATRAAVAAAEPGVVYHLAAEASVSRSWEAPAEVLLANTEMTVNVLEAVRLEAPDAVVVLTGSGEIYGPPPSLPVEEDAPLRPQNPYAVSKAACDLICGQYADAHGMRVVRLRAFNHAGPGQSDEYVVGTLTRQVAEAEAAGSDTAVLRVGNTQSRRDFTDVRDVVRAYVAAAELPAGAYNVCSGTSVSVERLIELIREAATIEVRHETDPARVRAREVEDVRGSAARLHSLTGWMPEIPLQRMVADALGEWRAGLAS